MCAANNKLIQAVPFNGGCITSVEPELLPVGTYSAAQNVRGRYPGLEQRLGQAKLHTTADGTNRVVSLYNFSKGQRVESHLFAQMGDGDVLEATALPPTVTTGVFGSEVFSGRDSLQPVTTQGTLKSYTEGNKDTDFEVDAAAVVTGTGTLVSYSEANQDNLDYIYNGGVTEYGQAKTLTGTHDITAVKFYLKKINSPTGNATAKIYSCTGTPGTSGKPTGAALATSGTFDVSTLTSTLQLITFTFSSPYTAVAGNYCFVLAYSGGDASNYVDIGIDTSSPGDTGGNTCYFASGVYESAPATDTIYYVLANTNYTGITKVGQAKALTGTNLLYSSKFYLKKVGSPTGNATAKVYAATGSPGTTGLPTGSALATSAAFDVSTLTTSYQLLEFIFTSPYSAGAGDYCITFEWNGGDGSNYVAMGVDGSSPTDDGNMFVTAEGVDSVMSDKDLIYYLISQTTTNQMIYDATRPNIPASWSTSNDVMVYSNGADQHQLYPGTLSFIQKLVVYKSASALPAVPTVGEDYTSQVIDSLTSTSAPLGTIGTNATDALCICCPFIPNAIKSTIGTANTNTATRTVYYWNGAWTQVSDMSDGTAAAGKTMAQTGTVSWTAPTDALPCYMFGSYGYWIKTTFSAALSSPTLTTVEYRGGWQSLVNLWDGSPKDVLEAQLFINSTGAYSLYGGSSIAMAGVTSSDKLNIATTDPIEAIFIDVGTIPNTTASTTISSIKYWNGSAMTTVGSFVDGTAGISHSGWVRIPRQAAVQPLNFNQAQYYAYWYEIQFDKTISASVNIGIQYIPYFDVETFGKGRCNCSWRGRMVYSFDRYPDYLYITPQNLPCILNGSNFGAVQVGSGAGNAVAAIREFYNEILVFQKEVGTKGGGLTLVQGSSPTEYSPLVLSSYLGAMNNNCVEVIDNNILDRGQGPEVRKLAFALSRYGVYAVDGKAPSFIDQAIKNYFNPTKAECVRNGYEDLMWMKYDATYNVLRLGLVSGSSATVPNVFPVYDLFTRTWSFDVLAQALACMTQCDAGSGSAAVLQVGGGTADGTVYLLNSGANDVSTAVESSITIELGEKGVIFNTAQLLVRFKAMTGNCVVTPYIKGVAQTTTTLSMVAEVTNQRSRRHRININITGDQVSLKFAHSGAGESAYYLDWGVILEPYGEQ